MTDGICLHLPLRIGSILLGGTRSYSKVTDLITVASISARWSGGEVGRVKGLSCLWIDIVGG